MSTPSSSSKPIIQFLQTYLHHHYSKPLSPISKIRSSNPKLNTPSSSFVETFDGYWCISTVGSSLVKGRIKDSILKVFCGCKVFWMRNGLVLVGGCCGVFVCVLLMFGVVGTFVGLPKGVAKYGALSSAMVAFAGLYLRSRFTINSDKIYRMVMRKLNTTADILEVMGAPLTGTDLRQYVTSGGGITLKNFKTRLKRKRCFLIFPVHGSVMKGLVSVEVMNKKGEHDMKLLAVEIPMAAGSDQRLFLIGDEEEYRAGGGLISELRDPVVKVMAAAKEFEARDIEEDKEDAQRELEDAERKHGEEIEKIEREGS